MASGTVLATWLAGPPPPLEVGGGRGIKPLSESFTGTVGPAETNAARVHEAAPLVPQRVGRGPRSGHGSAPSQNFFGVYKTSYH